MTTSSGSRRSRGSGGRRVTPGRRSLLLGGLGLGGASALALGHAGTAAFGQASDTADEPTATIDFDFDNGIWLRDLAINHDEATVEQLSALGGLVAPMDVTVLIRLNNLVNIAWFDALAPYHPTAVGICSRLGRRPAGERATNRGRNIASLHATYQVVKAVFPEREPAYRQLLVAIGLDPEDASEDRTSPVGIGNLAGKAVLADRMHDGINQLGDEGRTYNGRPYQDYTDYRPVNTAYELTHPSRWQPSLGTHNRRQAAGGGDKGIFTVQHFATPHMGLTRAHTFRDPRQFHIAPPRHSDHTRPRTYKRAVDEVLAVSAALTDEQKVKAEFFDNKLLGVGVSIFAAARAYERNSGPMDMDAWVQLFVTHTVAMFDVLIAVWHHKRRFDSVRPFSAIRHVYGSSPVTAWGGPGMGTVDDMPADEWASYLKVGDHPEYPSGSAALCAAEAAATRRFLGTDDLDFSFTIPAGTAVREPGVTPGRDIELHWATWTDFVRECADSRLWAGVHFSRTNERSVEFAEQFGDRAHDFVQRYVNGDVSD